MNSQTCLMASPPAKIAGARLLAGLTDVPVSGNDTIEVIEQTIRLGKKIKLWDEFQPNLYNMGCKLHTTVAGHNYEHAKEATFGMREVTASKDHVLINGHPVHLRGTVENAVFPQTGYAPVDDASWERILNILKEYGMNHMRFHSWCPAAGNLVVARVRETFPTARLAPVRSWHAPPDSRHRRC